MSLRQTSSLVTNVCIFGGQKVPSATMSVHVADTFLGKNPHTLVSDPKAVHTGNLNKSIEVPSCERPKTKQ